MNNQVPPDTSPAAHAVGGPPHGGEGWIGPQADEICLRLAAEATGLGIWEWNLTTNEILWDRQMFAIYGVPPTADGVVPYATWSGAVLPEDLAQQEQVMHETVRTRGRSRREFRIRRVSDGECRHLLAVETVRLDAAGNAAFVVGTNQDVTESRKKDEELRASEERFRTAAGIVGNIIWTNNAEGMMKGEQPGWGNFTGQTQEQYQDYGWAEAVHPDDRAENIAAWERAVAVKGVFEFQHRVRRWDGEWRTCALRAVPLLAADGSVREWVGVHNDITERLRLEEKRRVSEQRYKAVVDASSDIVYRMSPDWCSLVELEGRDSLRDVEQPTGTWLGDFILPEDQPLLQEAVSRAIETKGVFELEHRVRRLDGSAGWVHSRAIPQLNAQGEIVEWIGTASDITERRETEARLRENEEFMRSIIVNSPDCIKVLDPGGGLISMAAGQQMLGIEDIEPLLGKSWIDFWANEEDRSAAKAAVAKAAAGGDARFTGFFRTLRGEDRWWDVLITPMHDAEGNTERLLAVSRDVTQRREMENFLQARAAELERADRAKDEFLAMLAHELRNPLAPILNAAEILKATEATAEERQFAQAVLTRQMGNMTHMIDDLLDIARITEGKVQLRRRPVVIDEIVSAAVSQVRSACSIRGQNLTVALPDPPVYLNGDPTRLEQVLGNLLMNACRYSGDGTHISLTAEVEAPASSQGGEPVLILRVCDNGNGISPELLPHVFDLFVQSSRSLDRSHGGLGIGLTLVRRLVALHGGTVEAHSEGLGKGCEFVLRLPALREAPPPAPAPVPTSTGAAPLRMLIVDDNQDSVRSLAMIQKRRGHETRVAFTGPEALAAAAEFLPEVILLDIGLPQMDGLEVARRIRAMPRLADCFLVALSGYGQAEDIAEASAAGFDEYMVKPISLTRLNELLSTRVKKRAAPVPSATV